MFTIFFRPFSDGNKTWLKLAQRNGEDSDEEVVILLESGSPWNSKYENVTQQCGYYFCKKIFDSVRARIGNIKEAARFKSITMYMYTCVMLILVF